MVAFLPMAQEWNCHPIPLSPRRYLKVMSPRKSALTGGLAALCKAVDGVKEVSLGLTSPALR